MSNLEMKVDALLRLAAAENAAEREQARSAIRCFLDDVEQVGCQEDCDLQAKIRQALLELGVPDRIKGHSRLMKALELAIENPNIMGSITKEFYPAVGAAFETTGSRTERVMRHAIEVAWERCDLDVMRKYFGSTVHPDKGIPTTSEFITRVANAIAGGGVRSMYGRICPDCGAYLDPCEHCDCAEKAASGVATTEDGKGNKSNYIIT